MSGRSSEGSPKEPVKEEMGSVLDAAVSSGALKDMSHLPGWTHPTLAFICLCFRLIPELTASAMCLELSLQQQQQQQL